ncbi:MAG: hypothetical protein U0800_06835 [Isosphaeraceae bacterium]
MNIIIAGATFPCGAGELGEVARRHGLVPTFLDHPHNKILSENMLSSMIIGDGVPDALALQHGLFLPLLESWVSAGIRLTEGNALRFDRRAASISRSKVELSATLADADLCHVPRHGASTLNDALRAGSSCGYPVVLRADTGYSGRGVWVAESADDLRSLWSRQSAEQTSSHFAEMRSVMKADADVSVIEPWLSSREWSIDCIVGPAGAYLIRVCEKATGVVFGRPVTLGYRLTTDTDLWAEIDAAARKWCGVLFRPNELSFACFDIRRHPSGDLVPLDFGVRLGGDCIPLLVRHAGQGRNPYAAALDASLAGEPSRMILPEAGHALIHAYAHRPGVYNGLHVVGHGVVVNSKEHGFAIAQQHGVPVPRRVGSVLTYFDSLEEFDHTCATSSEWLHVVLL